MTQKILILDFGSQYTQLIARAVREANVYCEIVPYSKPVNYDEGLVGVILSGSPFSVNDEKAPLVDIAAINEKLPVLGICYGAQLTSKLYGGRVEKSEKREYGRAFLTHSTADPIFEGVSERTQVWMSHADTILAMPEGFELLATTDNIPIAAFKKAYPTPPKEGLLKADFADEIYLDINEGQTTQIENLPDSKTDQISDIIHPAPALPAGRSYIRHPLYGLQFHPEVYHSTEGKTILKNFLYTICGAKGDWTAANFVSETVEKLKQQIGDKKVIMALSGGVDSTVAATLISRAIGKNLFGIFVDNGVLRKGEFEQVLETYKQLDLNVTGIDAREHFYTKLAGKVDPEEKRKIIGGTFIEIFDQEGHKLEGIEMLGQGTIYPDVIESMSVHGPSQTIKSHHNVGGLPDFMKLGLVEPLRTLFKDEVRRVGLELGIPHNLLYRHPFPGPGLAIRILGEITEEKVLLLQQADAIFINGLKEYDLYDKVWQAGAILLPVKSVGVMGDERTYEFTIALRAVTSVDGMTADWAHLPYEFLAHISNEIINNVKGINRVVYDISSKPPATIEWE
jgi:GMP synthase (glutamine-hydrolysing)